MADVGPVDDFNPEAGYNGEILEGTATKSELMARGSHQVITEISSEAERDKIKFSQQGDELMYTAAALEQRYQNRTDPGILEAINYCWWRAANHTCSQ